MNVKTFLLFGPSVMFCASCTVAPRTICEMPANAHFWQGSEVSWTGDLIEYDSGIHGFGAEFWDKRCNRSIKLEVDHLIHVAQRSFPSSALSRAQVTGKIIFIDGNFRLKPASIKVLSSWKTGKEMEDYVWSEIRRQEALPRGERAEPRLF